MRNCCTDRVIMFAVLACLVGFTQMVFAFGQPTLSGIKLNDTFDVVLGVKGSPHSIGPTLESVADVNNILRPPPVTTMPMMTDYAMPPAMTPPGGMPPPGPGVNPPFGGAWPTPGMDQPVDPTADLKPKGRSEYVIWMYEGNNPNRPDPKSGWATYVVMNRGLGRTGRFNAGRVVAVAIWLYDQTATNLPAAPTTYNGIKLGSRMSEVTDRFGFPNPMIKIGNTFALNYSGVTYSVDAATRKVIGICLFDRLLTIVPNFTTLVEELPPTDMPGEGIPGMPGYPGMPGFPGGMPPPNAGMPNIPPPLPGRP